MVPRTGEWRFVCPYANCGKFYTRREFTNRHHIRAHGFQPDGASIKRVSVSDLAVQCTRTEPTHYSSYATDDSMGSVNEAPAMGHIMNGDYPRYNDSASSNDNDAPLSGKPPATTALSPSAVSTPLSHRKDVVARPATSDPGDLLVRLLHDQNLQIAELRNSLYHSKKENKRLHHMLSSVEDIVAERRQAPESNKRPMMMQDDTYSY